MERLAALMPQWEALLRDWAGDGRLVAAATEALRLPVASGPSKDLLTVSNRLAASDFSVLPPVEVLPGSALPSARGAYAQSTGTIYLNAAWLASARDQEVLAVLTEELGHHLDGLLNASDTPGDEGELFAALLAGESLSEQQHRSILVESDHASIDANSLPVAVERAATVISRSIPETSTDHATDQGSLSIKKVSILSLATPAISTQIITTLQDISSSTDGFLSLRKAIVQANTANEDGIIELAEGRYTLATADDLDIQLQGKTLTIQGQGRDRTILDGNRLDRLFEVHSGANVVISGVTITHGRAPDGGAIFNSGSLTISDSAMEDNQAVGIDGRPGLPGPDAEGFIGMKRKGGDGRRGDNGRDGSGGAIYNNGTITIANYNCQLHNR